MDWRRPYSTRLASRLYVQFDLRACVMCVYLSEIDANNEQAPRSSQRSSGLFASLNPVLLSVNCTALLLIPTQGGLLKCYYMSTTMMELLPFDEAGAPSSFSWVG
jgi:hypothetical protein